MGRANRSAAVRKATLAATLTALLGAGGCAVYGGAESTTIRVENGKADVTSRRVGGGVVCGPDSRGGTPCRTTP